MGKPKSLYLTDRTMEAVRGDEALSARVNQIADRYLSLLEPRKQWLIGVTSATEWDAMIRAYGEPEVGRPGLPADEVGLRLATHLTEPRLQNFVRELDELDLLALIEVLEAKRAYGAPPATHTPATHS